MLLSLGKSRWGGPEPDPVMTVRFTHDVDGKEILTKFLASLRSEK